MERNKIILEDYRIFFDGQKKGFDTINGTLVRLEKELAGVFGTGPFGDDEAGQHPFLLRTRDWGKTWAEPEPFGPPLVKNPPRESLGLAIFGPTSKGTLLAFGTHMKLEEKTAGTVYEDFSFRNYTLLIGRQEKGDKDFSYQQLPSGTFLGEQFMGPGIKLKSGRLVYQIWGAKARGENWRIGVLISDDDGINWRYREVGYEPDITIRDYDGGSAGFNEQSLFLTASGRIVSIIRGRDKLGRVESSPADTWFFRSVSADDGETWTKPELTTIAGTGAAGVGATLPDGSFLHACRVPYSRTMYALPEKELFGLHLARSFDEGKTWQSEMFIQHDPAGNPFNGYYDTMNGQFIWINRRELLYVFGHNGTALNIHRILAVRLKIN